MPKKWFQNWFNSPYYHILYQQRNTAEAEFFIDNLCKHLKLNTNQQMLDIACGRGRHSIYLNKKGFEITGIDLSLASIQYAKQFENDHLHFYVHDMRYLFYVNHFDVAFNLFTSFGYFETVDEHVKALKNFQHALKPGGLLVLDFFNTCKVIDTLCPELSKNINGIDFSIHKKIDGDKIVKTIEFEDQHQHYNFTEEVKAFCMADFQQFFYKSGFEIVHAFGNYSLEEYDHETSDRLIFICKKAA
jgi:SAM-dependent methyltransferase